MQVTSCFTQNTINTYCTLL